MLLYNVSCPAGVQTWLYLSVSLRSTPHPPGMLIITAEGAKSDGQERTFLQLVGARPIKRRISLSRMRLCSAPVDHRLLNGVAGRIYDIGAVHIHQPIVLALRNGTAL